MPGKELIRYDPDRLHGLKPKRSFLQKIGDFFARLVIGKDEDRFLPKLFIAFTKCFVMSWLITLFITLFIYSWSDARRGETGLRYQWTREFANWLNGRNQSWFDPIGLAMRIIYNIVTENFGLFLLIFGPWMLWIFWDLAKVHAPRAAKKWRDDQETELRAFNQKIRDHATMVKHQESLEVSKRQDYINKIRTYMRWRETEREKIEADINVSIARARKDMILKAIPDVNYPYNVVRERMMKTYPLPPNWGLLRSDRVADPEVRRVIGDGSWLPPMPPYPTEVEEFMRNEKNPFR